MNVKSSRRDKIYIAALLLTIFFPWQQPAAVLGQNNQIGRINLLNENRENDPRFLPYRPLLSIKSGDEYHYRNVRKSIENLYKIGVFTNIEVEIEARNGKDLDINFVLQKKLPIRSLNFTPSNSISKRELLSALYSLRQNDLYEASKMAKALNELREFLKTKGYLNPQISPRVSQSSKRSACDIQFIIAYGKIARIAKLEIDVNDKQLAKTISSYFKNSVFYIPAEFDKKIEKTKKLLKKHLYFFPEIKIQEDFLNPERSALNIKITIDCGYQYVFIFQGMPARMDIISNVWEREVFEKWAEAESRARLLNDLKNEGYLDVKITSSITNQNTIKTIVFKAQKNRRYRLGKIAIHGNQALSDEKIKEIIKSDDLIFNKLFWLRLNSLLVDLEVLKLFYYYQGISPIEIRLEPHFHGAHADIDFFISEGRKYRVENVEFSGNRAFSSQTLYQLIKSKTGSPFVQRQLKEDIDALQNYYWNNGFAEAAVSYELSPGERKSLLIKITENRQIKMGELIVIGASASQRHLLIKRFNLKRGEPFNKAKIDAFRSEMENSSIFAEFKLDQISKSEDRIDVLVKVIPDRSSFYGLGLGWEEKRGARGTMEPRGTLEYQEKNLLNTISSVAAILQLGLNERRGILSIDTPYFFKNKITSSFKAWDENEVYPSYQFNRWGLGASFVKKSSERLYFLGSLKWYRTKLTELKIPEIPEFRVDQLGKWFATTALSLSFVKENRDDPFNPKSGSFLTGDMKVGLPLFEKDYTFLKFFWNYQRHFPFLTNGVFSFSIKNGFGFGDMSITERFFAGGSHSFRGTSNDRLGPINPAENQPEGGNALLLFNLEVTVPSLLIPMEDLYYTFFADVGNVFAKSSDFNINKVERALGFGLKYRTPLGPIRLDFAYNLRRLARIQANKDFQIHIGIGNVY